MIKLLNFDRYTSVSEGLIYHKNNNIGLFESIYRPGSDAWFDLVNEVRSLYHSGKLDLDDNDVWIISTDLGLVGTYEGQNVQLDFPVIQDDLNEAEYKGKDVDLNVPKRGGSKKYYVYVKNPKNGNITKIEFGDTTGLNAKVSDPKARKSFAARHQCSTKKDKTTAGYWACRINRFGHLWGGKTYPGYW